MQQERAVVELKDTDLRHIEKLARVELSGASRNKLREQLGDIIGFVQKLQAIDTSGYSPKAYLGGFEPELRTDEAGECLSRDEVLRQAPDARNGLFGVPPVIDRDEP
jgi:aspartyl-tRNA(Asn)/glutamyl-tRNA(Gln) amidotransferase subunit C